MSPRIRAALVLASVFALGLLAGVAAERHRAPRHPPATSSAAHEAAMAELREVLELDDEQVGQIDAVMAENQRIVQLHWEQLRPEVQSAMRRVHTEITELLRPDQRRRFHEWLLHRLEQDEPERH